MSLGVAVTTFNFEFAVPSGMRASVPYPKLLSAHQSWFLCLLLLAVLPGCGPAVSDYERSSSSRASLSVQSESRPASQNNVVASPMPFAGGFASNIALLPSQEEQAVPVPEYLVLPTWIAQALDAPEVSLRLGALDRWAQQGAQAPLDPLIVALDDENEEVRGKAMAIIEQHWAIEQGEETAVRK